jgi:arylformamidase
MKEVIIDLSMDIYDGAPTMPMDPKCSVNEHCNLSTLGYNLSRLTISTHQGTHLDAPFHFFNDGLTVDRLDLSKCMGNAIKIDLSAKQPKEPLGIADMQPYERRICKGSRILLQTGWDGVYPEQRYFSDFPYVTTQLADWFADREICLLGMDMPTPNPKDWKYVHERLLGKGIVIVEGLSHLKEIPMDEFTFVALPLKIRGRDGSPLRAIAIIT